MRDQAQRLRELAARTRAGEPLASLGARGRVLAVASGKGGVGKTNVTANLGAALANRGHAVTLLDADLGLANLDILLNLNPRVNLGHVLRGEAAPTDAVVEVTRGLRVIPGASGIEAMADLGDRERVALLASLAPITADQDFVLIDAAAGIGRNVLHLCRAAGEILLVTDPEPTSLTDAYGLAKVLWSRDPRFGVRLVVNSVGSEVEGRAVHSKLEEVAARFLGARLFYLGCILRDECVGRAARRQLTFVTAYPRSPASRCVEALAEALLGMAPLENGGAQGFWRRLLASDGGSDP